MAGPLLRRERRRPLHVRRRRRVVQQDDGALCSMAGVRRAQIERVHRHVRQEGVGCPAQIGVAVPLAHVLQREQVGLLPPDQEQVVRRLAAGQLPQVQREAVYVKLRAAVTDQTEKTVQVLLDVFERWSLFDVHSPFLGRPGRTVPAPGSEGWPAGSGRTSSAWSGGAAGPG